MSNGTLSKWVSFGKSIIYKATLFSGLKSRPVSDTDPMKNIVVQVLDKRMIPGLLRCYRQSSGDACADVAWFFLFCVMLKLADHSISVCSKY